MKVLVVFAVLCFLRDTTGQEFKSDHKPGHQYNGDIAAHLGPPGIHVRKHVSDSKGQEENVQQNFADNSKVSKEIPSKVQQVVTQVSQHIPQVVLQHVAKQKQRVVRSVKNRAAWQTLQVPAMEKPRKCVFFCSSLDLTVCGYNGRCYWEFESQCNLSSYNCLNTDKIFHAVNDAKCQDKRNPKCYKGDL